MRKEPWSGAKEFLKFHEDDKLVLDLEELPEHKKIRSREELAEMVRQLYVGLTRAKHRSYLIWQERKTKSKSALAWLFSEEASADAFLEEKGESNTSGRVRAAFGERDLIAVEDLPEGGARVFPPVRRYEHRWRREFSIRRSIEAGGFRVSVR